jgi:hypothetical protein
MTGYLSLVRRLISGTVPRNDQGLSTSQFGVLMKPEEDGMPFVERNKPSKVCGGRKMESGSLRSVLR